MSIAIKHKYLNILFILFIAIVLIACLLNYHIGYSKIISGMVLLTIPIYIGYSTNNILNIKKIFRSSILNNFLPGFLLLILLAFISLVLKIDASTLIAAIGIIVFIAIIYNTIITIRTLDYLEIKIQNIYQILESVALITFAGVICYLGSNVVGDISSFHIPIASKVNDILDPSLMTVTKKGFPYPGYLFPVWHTLIGILSKVLNTPASIIWTGLAWPLTIVAVLAWKELTYFFITTKDDLLSLLVTITIIIVLTIKDVTFFYLAGLLPSPCQLCDFVLMPLALLCSLKFLCNGGFRLILITSALYLTMTIIHGPHMLYLPIQLIALSIVLLIVGLLNKDKQMTKNSTIVLSIFTIIGSLLVLFGQYYSKINDLPTNIESYNLLSARRLVPIIILIPISLILIKKFPKKFILPSISVVLIIQSLIIIPPNTLSSLFHVALRRAHTTSLAYTIIFWPLFVAALYSVIQKLKLKKIMLLNTLIIVLIIGIIGFNVSKLKDFTTHYITINASQPYKYIDKEIINYILKNLNNEVIISDIYVMSEVTQYSNNYSIYYKGEKTHEREIIKKDINNIINKDVSIDTIINICSKYNARYIILQINNHNYLSLSEQEEIMQLVTSGKNQALYKIGQ